MPDLIGKTLGGYRIIEQIGMGGMATVYRAYHATMDRYVAVKVLPEQMSQDESFRRCFEQEVKVVACLEHAYILPVHDYGEAEGRLYLVMRYIEAGTLKDRLARGPLDLAEVSRIIRQVGRALEYAHRMGVVHRDVKPSNVLVDAQGDCYLTDFGLARMLEASAQLTAPGVGVGTSAYMSPEQGRGERVDVRSDVYSLGVMLYEMVTGRVPYEAETPLAVILKHITAPLPLPREVAPGIPEGVERVILRALAKDADDRFQTVGEMVAALDVSVQGADEKAPRPVTVPLVALPARLLAAIGLGLVVLVVLAAAGALWGGWLKGKTDGRTAAVQATATQVTANIFATQMAATSTATPTPMAVFTPTATSTPTPISTPTPARTPTPTPTDTPMPTPCLPDADLLADVTVPDGTNFVPGERFTKTWRVRSSGCVPWPAGTTWVFVSGDQMGASDSIPMPEIPLGDAFDISVEMIAPNAPGTYKGLWQMQGPAGDRFGEQVYVMIVVPVPKADSVPIYFGNLAEDMLYVMLRGPADYDFAFPLGHFNLFGFQPDAEVAPGTYSYSITAGALSQAGTITFFAPGTVVERGTGANLEREVVSEYRIRCMHAREIYQYGSPGFPAFHIEEVLKCDCFEGPCDFR